MTRKQYESLGILVALAEAYLNNGCGEDEEAVGNAVEVAIEMREKYRNQITQRRKPKPMKR